MNCSSEVKISELYFGEKIVNYDTESLCSSVHVRISNVQYILIVYHFSNIEQFYFWYKLYYFLPLSPIKVLSSRLCLVYFWLVYFFPDQLYSVFFWAIHIIMRLLFCTSYFCNVVPVQCLNVCFVVVDVYTSPHIVNIR